MINKYEYLTGRKLATYETIKEASIDNNMSYHTIYKELHNGWILQPRRDFYFGYDPKQRWVIKCYDNESRKLLGTYINIKQASMKTGVDASEIQWQVNKALPFDKRYMGCTGLWFERGVITK